MTATTMERNRSFAAPAAAQLSGSIKIDPRIRDAANLSRLKRRVITTLSLWYSLSAERRALGKLTGSELDALGVTRLEADREARRWFFDVPNGR